MPTYNPDSPAEYCQHVLQMLKERDLLCQLPSEHLEIVRQFCDMDLSEEDRIMREHSSAFGPAPRQPSDMLRSMLLSAVWGISSYTEWARTLKTVPFPAIVSGCAPGDVPGVGTFCDLIDRLWLAEESNFGPSVQPERVRPPEPAPLSSAAAGSRSRSRTWGTSRSELRADSACAFSRDAESNVRAAWHPLHRAGRVIHVKSVRAR